MQEGDRFYTKKLNYTGYISRYINDSCWYFIIESNIPKNEAAQFHCSFLPNDAKWLTKGSNMVI